MSVIMDVILEEGMRLEALIEEYNKKISQYPKGSISIKRRGEHSYCYRAFRDNSSKVRFIYLGKDGSEEVSEFKKKMEERKSYEERKKKSIENLKEIRKLLHAAN